MKSIYLSLSAFQKECPIIHKGNTGYGYSYADLPSIFEIINPLLDKHNLGFTQPIIGSKLKTVLFHTESGETIESEIDIPQNVQLKGMNDFQVLGSAITYLRRYAISSILGIVTDKDTDANGEQNKQPQQPQQNTSIPYLNPNTPEWEKVISALKNGHDGKTYTISDIKKKYRISAENQEKLLSETQK